MTELVGPRGRHDDATTGRAVPSVVTALVCDSDPMRASWLAGLAEQVGFDVLPAATTAVEALDMVGRLAPHAVVVVNELLGMSGIEAVADLRRLADAPEIVLLTADVRLGDDPRAEAVFAVVDRDDVAAVEDALAGIRGWLTTGERRSGTDRRSGDDRRREQDWSKVYSERRSGDDRRKGPRRQSER